MKRNFLLLLFFIGGLVGNVFAQEQFSQVSQWLDNHVDDMGGRAILIVYQDGKIVYSQAVNRMNNRQKILGKLIASRQGKIADFSDYTPNSKQPIASCSKWLSAALIMTFVDEGKLKLTDTVGRFLPVLSKNGKGAITIKQCLSHTTGILSPDLRENLKEMRTVNSMDEAIEQIAQYPVEGQAGKVFRYSNTGLQIAGAVVEKISGKSFETLFAERIAWPLDMKNTDFGKTKVALPAGGASSTPNDYMNFLTMILNKGRFREKQILSEKSIAEMQVNRITTEVKVAYSPAEAGGLGYGFGEWIMTDGAIGSPGLFGSFPWINNDKKYCAFLMTFYLKTNGRQEKYVELRKQIEASL